MTEFRVLDKVRHKTAHIEGVIEQVLPNCGDTGCVRVSTDSVFKHWMFENTVHVSPDWIGPALTPEEDGARSTIDVPAFERAVAERKDAFEHKVVLLFEEAEASLLSKHHDYGPLNIARSPGGPLNGLRVRLWDKLARLNHLVDSGAEPENESLEDTFRDIVGYGAIGLLVLRNQWPNE